ncbi:MAG TPA: family 10 glycosylhydrolase [Bacteroidota bacterium]|nr:family 10 glycosylhydrolase [Bacteroidota bacterium]
MRTASSSIVCSLLLLSSTARLHAQQVPTPKCEVRAVWLTTASGLDWPQSTDRMEQQASLRDIIRRLHAENFNMVIFQVRARGDAYYRSTIEPWAENLTGTLGKDPGWDPLAFLINEAHACGIEVHAWINMCKVRSYGPSAPSVPPHVSRVHSDWVISYRGEGWLDPGIPEVRTYLENVVLDLVRNYDLDGINYDYLRYPGHDFADQASYRRYGEGINHDLWRKSNLDRIVSECYDRVTSLRPSIKIGCAPLGIFGTDTAFVSSAAQEYYQDARSWLRSGKLDYVSPQLYWNIGGAPGEPDFIPLLRGWQKLAGNRQVYAGIGAYKGSIAREIPAQIDSARRFGSSGEAFFRYESIKGNGHFAGRFATPAIIPAMSWKSFAPPEAPPYVAVTEVTTNVFALEWIAPEAVVEGDPYAYAVYRSSTREIERDDPHSLVTVVPRGATTYTDSVRAPNSATYYYAVSALDRACREGPASPVTSGTMREFLSLKGKLNEVTGLSATVSTRSGAPTLVAYTIARRAPVTLEMISHTENPGDTMITTLVHDTQDCGTYVVGLKEMQFTPGRYTVRLRAGQSVVEQSIDLGR